MHCVTPILDQTARAIARTCGISLIPISSRLTEQITYCLARKRIKRFSPAISVDVTIGKSQG
jgi:hypothetical protein